MKKFLTLTALFVGILLTFNGIAQVKNYGSMISQNEDGTYFYMRSSLEMVYIESDYFPNKELVDRCWNNYMDPNKNFPNQYNKHGVDIGTVNIGSTKDVSEKEIQNRITSYLSKNKVANKLVMKWFNYNPSGTINYDIDYPENPDAKINMQTVFDRGYYTVNAGDENIDMTALKRDRDVRIKELSTKLLPFTFMTFTKFEFYENEPIARGIRDAAIVAAKVNYNAAVKNGANPKTSEIVYKIAVVAANAAYQATKDGYTLKSNTWLYKLVWDAETERYFNDEVIRNPRLLETSNKFRMEYVDCQDNKSTVIISATRSFEQIINLTMVRNLNKVFIVLQNRNEVFRVWTPILDFHSLVSPNLTAPITVNGKIITEMGTRVNPSVDTVLVDGRPLPAQARRHWTVMLNKPVGYVTTMSDERGRPCIADLVGGVGSRVYPVGRLDIMSEGLLLLTNDGELANTLTHPRYHKPKIYRVEISGELDDETARALSVPFNIDGYITKPAKISVVSKGADMTVLEMTLFEGRNRQGSEPDNQSKNTRQRVTRLKSVDVVITVSVAHDAVTGNTSRHQF